MSTCSYSCDLPDNYVCTHPEWEVGRALCPAKVILLLFCYYQFSYSDVESKQS